MLTDEVTGQGDRQVSGGREGAGPSPGCHYPGLLWPGPTLAVCQDN